MSNIGKLIEVDVRELWKHEAYDALAPKERTTEKCGITRVCHQRKGRIQTGQRIKAQKAKIIYTYDVPKD